MFDLKQSMGQPEKLILNLWWAVGVPNSFSSTSRADAWASIRPFGLYSQPPQAVGTLTRAPQEATFWPDAARSATMPSKSLMFAWINSTDCRTERWTNSMPYFSAVSAIFFILFIGSRPPGTRRRTVNRSFSLSLINPPVLRFSRFTAELFLVLDITSPSFNNYQIGSFYILIDR